VHTAEHDEDTPSVVGSGRRWIAVPSAKQTLEQDALIPVGPAAHELHLLHSKRMGHVNGHYLKFKDFSSATTFPEIEHMGFAELMTSNESIENVATRSHAVQSRRFVHQHLVGPWAHLR
jgi:hypothetical protein